VINLRAPERRHGADRLRSGGGGVLVVALDDKALAEALPIAYARAAALGAEVLQRGTAELRGLGEPLEAADVGQRHRGADAPPDLLLLEHEPWTVRGQNRTGLDSKDRPG